MPPVFPHHRWPFTSEFLRLLGHQAKAIEQRSPVLTWTWGAAMDRLDAARSTFIEGRGP